MGVEGEEKFRGPDGAIQDDYRIDFIKEHLTELARGIDEAPTASGIISGRSSIAGAG